MFKFKTGDKGEAVWLKEHGRVVEIESRKAVRNFVRNRDYLSFDVYENDVKIGTHTPSKPFKFSEANEPQTA